MAFRVYWTSVPLETRGSFPLVSGSFHPNARIPPTPMGVAHRTAIVLAERDRSRRIARERRRMVCKHRSGMGRMHTSGVPKGRRKGSWVGHRHHAVSRPVADSQNQASRANKRKHPSKPEESLERGQWVKLICGASFEDVVSIRALATVYALAGVDCIDCAADQAVVQAVKEGIAAAAPVAIEWGRSVPDPWIMVSVNDGNDPHFRKAVVKPDAECPVDCSRPCEAMCPAAAFQFKESSAGTAAQVAEERCYGCGRCMPVCPHGLLEEEWYRRSPAQIAGLLQGVDAIEIHTRHGHLEEFRRLWEELAPALRNLKLVAVSAPRLGTSTAEELAKYHACMLPPTRGALLWQLDGRPMSGDIGRGTTQAVVRLASDVVATRGELPGYLQLAGGTNSQTRRAAEEAGLLPRAESEEPFVHGVAFGGIARKLLSSVLEELEAKSSVAPAHIEQHPLILQRALDLADGLVAPWKNVSTEATNK